MSSYYVPTHSSPLSQSQAMMAAAVATASQRYSHNRDNHHAGHRPSPTPPTELDMRARPFHQVSHPATHKPSEENLFVHRGGEKKINAEYLKNHFICEGRLTEPQALYILEHATRIFSLERNMVPLKSPVTICGDVHGQYYDLIKLFEVGGSLEDSLYLFLGDYVDRGSFGIECLLYLYALKINAPGRIVMLRGNHECRYITELFTFKRECLHKYSEAVYEACLRSFCSLPIAAVVDGRFFCVHGGISPLLVTLADLGAVNRFQEPSSQGLLCDLLWSDPIPNYGRETEPTATGAPGVDRAVLFTYNTTRGCSHFYTYHAVCQFLERNGLLTLIRAHEAQNAGYATYRKTPERHFPSIISIFSAPNYEDIHNRGAILHYANKNISIRQYNSTLHPAGPNFMELAVQIVGSMPQRV